MCLNKAMEVAELRLVRSEALGSEVLLREPGKTCRTSELTIQNPPVSFATNPPTDKTQPLSGTATLVDLTFELFLPLQCLCLPLQNPQQFRDILH